MKNDHTFDDSGIVRPRFRVPGRTILKTYEPYSTIVIEISGGRQMNRTELREIDPELPQLVKYAASQKSRLVAMASEQFSVFYFFLRTDDLPGTYAALGCLEEAFRDEDFYCGTMIYMDKLTRDSIGLAEKLLPLAGVPYSYTDGERSLSYAPPRRGGKNYRMNYSLDELFSFCRERIIGQDEQLKKALFLIDRFVAEMSERRRHPAPRGFFLTAPSGSGKTELYRSVKEFFARQKLPVAVVNVDASQFTPAGYKGSDISAVADAVLKENAYREGGCAVCFLDEADKKVLPDADSDGGDFNAMAQRCLLRMLEGCEIRSENCKDEFGERGILDTGRVLFILMGSFQDVRDSRCDVRRPAGFGSSRTESSGKGFDSDITIDEMIEAGMLEEIAGRISRVINFRPIEPAVMRDLLRRRAEMLGAERNAEIILTDNAVDELVPLAYTRLGVRRPLNIISELADDALTEAAYSGELYCRGENVVVIDSLRSASFSKRIYRLPEEEDGSSAGEHGASA